MRVYRSFARAPESSRSILRSSFVPLLMLSLNLEKIIQITLNLFNATYKGTLLKIKRLYRLQLLRIVNRYCW